MNCDRSDCGNKATVCFEASGTETQAAEYVRVCDTDISWGAETAKTLAPKYRGDPVVKSLRLDVGLENAKWETRQESKRA